MLSGNRRRFIPSLLTALLLSVSSHSQAHGLDPVNGLLTPESVVQAADGKIYVSEINEFGKDGDGQIRVIDHGKSAVLVQGLDDPKGLTIIGNDLFVADKNRIWRVTLDQSPAKAEVYIPASAFPQIPQFLNDLAADANGNLYVSDSGDIMGTGKGGAVYKIPPQGKPALLIDGQADARILAPNGLLADAKGEHLLIVDFTSGILYDYDVASHRLQEIASGFGGADGLVRQANGTIYVSDWKAGKVYRVDNHKAVLVKEGYQSAADIALSQDGHHLLVPDMKAGVLDVIQLH
ncbi:SMP-30/Gluconolaconase/LRE-like region-containing protein [Methylophilus rhizosphaerae]|uniref:SMP-30/Gluconolaconase/LRE-like region-containing protein n=1 Tax=Methylophilus rhizosphaerae TaxID=492660 RepID=A0A1G8ZZT9_9PROT|nr:SMP-30/gluconolactonase/LRE family protein [Methylophilus rhizosphaerae]SDK20134.1 SMP-30/Gluconolaconase/LRE-like region-containing protein [Methylophilus rhizosphaerae]